MSLLLTAVTPAVFWPVRLNDFVNYDDPSYVTDNTHVQHGLTWQGVVSAFRTGHSANWHPLKAQFATASVRRWWQEMSAGKNPLFIGTLAAAYAETGRFAEAVAAAQRALQLATAQNNPALTNALRVQITTYQASYAFRDTRYPRN